MSRQVVKSMTF